MRNEEITFWEFLLLPSERLAERGVPARDVARRRFEVTGHVRALDRAWAPTFGCWGGVEDLDEIARRAGRTREQAREHAKGAGLRAASRRLRRTHAELALLLWCDRAGTPQESCTKLGVLPGERRLLAAAAQVMIEAAGGIGVVLAWTIGELEAEFARLSVSLRPPAHLLVSSGHHLISMEVSQ